MVLKTLLQGIRWLKARFGERSTWVGIGIAIAAASALPHPWDYVSFVIGVIGSFVPDGKVNTGL